MTADDLAERLARCYTGAVHDVMRAEGLADFVLPPDLRPLIPEAPLAGPVWTVSGSVAPGRDPHATLLAWTGLLSKAPEGHVVVCQPNDSTIAHMGELSGETLLHRGVRGYVVDGGCRDARFLIDMGFQVFCRYFTPRDIVGVWMPEGFGEPIRIGETEIRTGDYLIGDRDGVVVIPGARAADVIARTEEAMATEDLVVVAMKVVDPRTGCEAVVATRNSLAQEPRMNVHKHARMTVHGRYLVVCRVRQKGWRVRDAAVAAGISPRTASKWLARYRAGGMAALRDRGSAPRRCRHRLAAARVAEIERLRRLRWSSPRIARALGMPVSTVGAVLRRLGLGRLAALEPKAPAVRYERARPGELIHIDTKKLGRIDGVGHRITGDRTRRKRGLGWEHLHVAIDDCSRLAYTEILPDERGETCAGFLDRAVRWFAGCGVRIERVMTDNAFAYTNSRAFKDALVTIGARHITTRPYRPRTNGKAERFIQTALREWLYAKAYHSSQQRTADMPAWLHWYNHHRPHTALKAITPAKRLNNVLGNDS